MRMLNTRDEETDVEVTWEDQQKINTFSKLNARLSEAEELLKKKKQEKEALDDLSQEIELFDEEEPVLYKVGEAFVHIPVPRAQKMLEAEQKELEKEISDLQDRAEECEKVMKELKVVLYGKFGKAINLDV
ncbi:hypothetical protein FRC03_000251 [Tulasnella sp. 419]|nr:hypothetical protein FRC02_009104 [Tulasnella sp. 418]KAG8965711.1 hypothetical protein FRC03_000251 [Tulasnella sp. 419]